MFETESGFLKANTLNVTTGVLDVSGAANSAQACRMIEEFVDGYAGDRKAVELYAGYLLLTRGVLTKIAHLLKRAGITITTVYTSVPQTQQAALDEGFFVKEKPAAAATRMSLPQTKPASKSGPVQPEIPQDTGVDIPRFSASPEMEAVKTTEELIQKTAEATAELEAMTSEKPRFTVSPEKEIVSPRFDEIEETLFHRHTLRSGQVLQFQGNIVVLGDVHAGSEIVAGGDIVVWGELRGIAHAGAPFADGEDGNYRAEIRAMKIEALQLRIADYIARRPDRIYYHKDQETVLPTPEVARVSDGEIRIFRELIG